MQIPSPPFEQESRGPDYQQPVIFDGNRGHQNKEVSSGRSDQLQHDVLRAIKAADALGCLTQERTGGDFLSAMNPGF